MGTLLLLLVVGLACAAFFRLRSQAAGQGARTVPPATPRIQRPRDAERVAEIRALLERETAPTSRATADPPRTPTRPAAPAAKRRPHPQAGAAVPAGAAAPPARPGLAAARALPPLRPRGALKKLPPLEPLSPLVPKR